MSEKLKPCPFKCGADYERHPPIIVLENGDYAARCGWCGAQGEYENDELKAALSWNTRAPSPALRMAKDALERIKDEILHEHHGSKVGCDGCEAVSHIEKTLAAIKQMEGV